MPKHLTKDEAFWPTAVGTKWICNQSGEEYVEEVTQADRLKDRTRLTVRLTWGGTSEEAFDVSAGGVVQRATFGRECNLALIRFPLRVGATWAFEFNQGNYTERGEAKVGSGEDVQTPAGTFHATKVVLTVTAKDKKPIKNKRTYTY